MNLTSRRNRELKNVYKQRSGITTLFSVETSLLETDSSGKKLVADRGGEGPK